ncbi:MAG: hypothetical protein P8X55_13365 [Desulfosarcinaceae bacterium]
MQLIIYAAPLNMIGRSLVRGLNSLLDSIDLHTFVDIPSLAAHLRKPMGAGSLCILVPADSHELLKLNTIRHLMRDMRLVLILPDRKDDTVSEGHFLRPRFVSYPDRPLADVLAVVEKMLGGTPNPKKLKTAAALSASIASRD